jgi:hypothetical protein
VVLCGRVVRTRHSRSCDYLAKSWRRLDRVYRNSPSFFVALEALGDDYRHTRVIGEAAVDTTG